MSYELLPHHDCIKHLSTQKLHPFINKVRLLKWLNKEIPRENESIRAVFTDASEALADRLSDTVLLPEDLLFSICYYILLRQPKPHVIMAAFGAFQSEHESDTRKRLRLVISKAYVKISKLPY